MYELDIDPDLIGDDMLVSSSETGTRRNPKKHIVEQTFRAEYDGEGHDYVMIKEELGPKSIRPDVVKPNLAAGLTLKHMDITAPLTMPDPSKDHVVYIEHLDGYELLEDHPGYPYGGEVYENFLDAFSSRILIGDTDISNDDLLIDTETGDVAPVDFTGSGKNKIEKVSTYLEGNLKRIGRIFQHSRNIDSSDLRESLTRMADTADIESIEEELSRAPRLEGYYRNDTIIENINKVKERDLDYL